MKIAILTADEPLYLPPVIDRVLTGRAKDTVGVFICAPVHKNYTKFGMFRRYVRAFGWCGALALARRVLWAKIRDKPGLGYRRRLASVASAARYHGVHVEYADDVNAPTFLEWLRSHQTDLILSIFCPQTFQAELVTLPAQGCLNIHGADLPNYRGLFPSFWMLANDEKQAAVTIFYVSAGLDTGDVIGKKLFPILRDDTLHSFIVRSKQIGSELILETLDRIERGEVTATPLVGKGSCFGWPTREAYRRFRKLGRRLK